MSIQQNLHPLWKNLQGFTKPTAEVNDALINALQSELDRAEESMYSTKLDSYLDHARGNWLDYWGSWLGLHRLSGEDDYTYREKLKHHVLHSRNTIASLREAIADYFHININNIYIYEPYRDMFIYNSSKWNSYKFFPSTYYRYAVIDVQIDAPVNIIANEIINLFRPAGVIWVMTSLVNTLNAKAPIIDFETGNNKMITEDLDFVGFTERDANYILPNYDPTIQVTNPFHYNKDLLNGGKEYYDVDNFSNLIWIGKVLNDYTPQLNEDTGQAKEYVEQLNFLDNSKLSRLDRDALTIPYNSQGLGGAIDLYNALSSMDPLYGSNPKEAVLNKLEDFPVKNLITYMRTRDDNQQVIHPYVYDFVLNMWVKFDDYTLTDNYQVYNFSLSTLKNYLNNNGILYVKFMFENQNPILLDYFGFDYEKDSTNVMQATPDDQSKMGADIQ